MMQARITNLHKTEAEWNNFADLQPKAGELIIYDPDENHSYARLKIGDGNTYLKDLKFYVEYSLEDLFENNKLFSLDSGRITGPKYLD